jgi:hypothetical protein
MSLSYFAWSTNFLTSAMWDSKVIGGVDGVFFSSKCILNVRNEVWDVRMGHELVCLVFVGFSFVCLFVYKRFGMFALLALVVIKKFICYLVFRL